jgi:O-antigen/teichoic acid export membrane protein
VPPLSEGGIGEGAQAAAADPLVAATAGRTAARGGVLRVAGYAASIALSVGSAAILFRHLGVADGGRYVAALTVVAIFGALVDAGLTALGTRELAVTPREERRARMRVFMGLRVAATTAGMVAATIFAALVGYPATVVAGISAAGLGLLIQHAQTTMSIPLLTDLRLGLVTLLDLLRQVVAVGLIVALVATGAGLVAFLAVPIPASLVALAATAWVVRTQVSLRPALRLRSWLPLLREALPLAAATAVAAIHFRIPVVLVSLVSGTGQTGYFGASFRVVDVLLVAPQLLFGATFPILVRAARENRARLREAIVRMSEVAVIAGAAVALILALAAPFVVDVVAGARFEPAGDVLTIHAAALGLAFVTAVFSYALLSLGAYRDVLRVNLAALVVALGGTAILATASGARGAAVAAVGTEAVLVTVSGWVLVRRLPELRFSMRVPLRVLAALGVSVAASVPLGLPSILRAALGGTVFIGTLAALRGFPPDLTVALRGRRAHSDTPPPSAWP